MLADKSVPSRQREFARVLIDQFPSEKLPLDEQARRARALLDVLCTGYGAVEPDFDDELRRLITPRGSVPVPDDTPFSPAPRRRARK